MKFPNWRRNKTTNSNLPPEVQAYNKSEHRERMGMAWLVGVVSLIVTALILTGLFFGGRWVYRKIAGTDQKPDTSQTTNDQDSQSGDQDGSNEGDEQRNPKTPVETTPPAPQPTPTPQPEPAPNPNLPRTGPDLDL